MLVGMDLDGPSDPWATDDLFEEKESDGLFEVAERQHMTTSIFLLPWRGVHQPMVVSDP